ncbi:MAG TPA: ATP-binding protein [Cyclobacteriaceae bacterium]|nr:ATP-binding protein [Cyclobacteriaceae bacterium]
MSTESSSLRTETRLLNRFRPRIAIRLLAICIAGSLTGFLIFNSPYWLAGLWTALLTGILFYETVHFVGNSEQKLTTFLQSLAQNDFTVTFPERRKSADYNLHSAFNSLNAIFNNLRTERESQHQLLLVVVEHAGVPMICFDENTGEVFLVNNALKTLLKLPFVRTIGSLTRSSQNLPAVLKSLRDGEQQVIKITESGKAQFLSTISTHIIFRNRNLKLVVMHNVSNELAAKEAESWQKLIRVLTHEISNSAIPLSTLSSHIYGMVDMAALEKRPLSEDERKDAIESLKTIDQRSRSLKEFVENFRSFNRIPEPDIQFVSLKEMVDEVSRLFSGRFKEEKIFFSAENLDGQMVLADRNLTTQVMINLVRNAIESLEGSAEKRIRVISEKDGTRNILVRVIDSGCGIDKAELDQIFIPFYTTKRGGSGIGLSISQQIMYKQKGNISVVSDPGKGSVFTLRFSC